MAEKAKKHTETRHFLNVVMDVRPMMIMTILDDFGRFIFKAHFENFLEFLDSRTQIVNSRTPRCL